MALKDVTIRSAKPEGKPYKLWDAEGLYLHVSKAGARHWRMKYRHLGAEKLLSFGPYPKVTLAEAREMRDAAKKQLRAGVDPSEAIRQAKFVAAQAATQTFGLIAQEFIDRQRQEGRAAATIDKSEWLLQRLATPLTKRPISLITAPELLSVLRKIEAKGNLETAKRLRGSIGRVFRYAIITGRVCTDPTPALAGALLTPRVRHQAAITDADRVGDLLRAIYGSDGSTVIRAALQIMALCFPRPGELRHARWTDVDLDAAVWSIPAERTKMRRVHVIPLAPQAVAILKELRKATGDGELIFPGVRRAALPLSENTLNAALRRLGFSAEEMTSHGFRTVASTLLNESGHWSADAIERALSHLDASTIRRAYARGEYWDERVRMAKWWADYLDDLRMAAKPLTQPASEKAELT